MPAAGSPKPTGQNNLDSDGTAIFTHGKLSCGSDLTKNLAIKHHNHGCISPASIITNRSSRINADLFAHETNSAHFVFQRSILLYTKYLNDACHSSHLSKTDIHGANISLNLIDESPIAYLQSSKKDNWHEILFLGTS